MKRASAAALVLVLCGCAGLSEAECRGADWYEVGFRDAIFALRPQEAAYSDACAKHGVSVDTARYAQGWVEGKYEAEYRNPEPIH